MSGSGTQLCFDLETTGVDTEEARIVQAFLGLMDHEGNWVRKQEWIVDPGVEVPEGAAAVHGFTTERLQREGRKDVVNVLLEIARIIESETRTGSVLTIYNAPYDTSVLNAELRRHGLKEIDYSEDAAERIYVIDPLVLDKGVDKYRKGSRKLVDTARHYGVPVAENAHDAGADCLMTGRVALRLLQGTALDRYSVVDLQRKQRVWKREQSASLQAWFRKQPGQENEVVDGSWPVRVVAA